ncbi:MAG: Gfo/Idh/MocA family oxidoreductase [Paracoccaceae bacterium]
MRLLVLGTGGMAHQHATEFRQISGVAVVAGVDTNAANLAKFCSEFDIPQQFSSLQAALEWGQFDAVANVTPDNAHYPTTMACLAAGKHVFCEKPLATNYAHADEMVQAAAGLVAMVNLTYRNVSALQKAREMVLNGDLGTVKHIEASYLQSWLSQPAWGDWRTESQWLWRLSTAHGSLGVLGDVGIHILDFASYAAGSDITDISCRLKTFHKAEGDRIGDYVLDANDSFAAHIGFDCGAVGVVHASRFASGHLNDLHLRIYGECGGLEVTNSGDLGSLRASIGADMPTAIWRDVPLAPVETNYQRFAQAVAARETREPSFERAAALQKILNLALESDKAAR